MALLFFIVVEKNLDVFCLAESAANLRDVRWWLHRKMCTGTLPCQKTEIIACTHTYIQISQHRLVVIHLIVTSEVMHAQR